jgi:hypothetical protein
MNAETTTPSFDYNVLYEEDIVSPEIPAKKATSVPAPLARAPAKRKQDAEDERLSNELKDEKEKREREKKEKEESEKREYIKKIKSALSDDLMGGFEELAKYKNKKYVNMSLKEIKAIWQEIYDLSGDGHPRHAIYKGFILAARKVEQVLMQYPDYKAPGLADKIEKDKELKLSIHMTALDMLSHNSSSGVIGTAYKIWGDYEEVRAHVVQDHNNRTKWFDLDVPVDIQEKYKNL